MFAISGVRVDAWAATRVGYSPRIQHMRSISCTAVSWKMPPVDILHIQCTFGYLHIISVHLHIHPVSAYQRNVFMEISQSYNQTPAYAGHVYRNMAAIY